MAALAIPLPIEKAPPTTLVEVADRASGSMTVAALDWLSSLQNINPSDLNRAAIHAKLVGAFSGAGLAHHENSLHDLLLRTLTAGAQFGIHALDKFPVQKFESVGATMSFNSVNPSVLAFLQSYTFSLINDVTTDALAAIRLIFLRGVNEGLSPAQQAKLIEPLIGLSERQSLAVENYRLALEQGQYKQTLDRVLRDGRYDRMTLNALSNGKGLTAAQIDKMVQRYAERSLRFRAQQIARTETIRAANAGQIEAWKQAQSQGLLGSQVREHWLIADDERTCPICTEIPEMNPFGVAIGGQFETPYGPLTQPPAHTTCRCALGLK